jgi:hypothetical protein
MGVHAVCLMDGTPGSRTPILPFVPTLPCLHSLDAQFPLPLDFPLVGNGGKSQKQMKINKVSVFLQHLH